MGYNVAISIEETELQTSGTVTEPVALVDMKNWLKIDNDYTDDDALITGLIRSARKRLEKYTGCSFINKAVNATLNVSSEMELPSGPIQGALTSVNRLNPDGTIVPLTIWTDYTIYGVSFQRIGVPGSQPLELGPGIQNDQVLQVIYNAGYSPLPDDLVLAIKQQVAFDYENRGDEPAVSGRQGGRSRLVGDGVCYSAQVTAFPYMRMNL